MLPQGLAITAAAFPHPVERARATAAWAMAAAMSTAIGPILGGVLTDTLYAVVGPQADLWVLELSFLLAGAGLALTTAPAVSLAMSAVPVQRSGLASGVVNLARLLGITVGVAVLGSALAAIGGVDGARTAMAIGGVVQLIGAAAALRWARPDAPAPVEKEVCHA
ncbi:hypothetical protein [Mycobacterium sp.]|uniref:hypothetical protein n=1 Tax=Mycobacterium sp. TaxID=1785 RepID=UPI002D82FED5|nr:hypothetical protein [Mycobacterium sp.]